jgi:hypothetical protein
MGARDSDQITEKHICRSPSSTPVVRILLRGNPDGQPLLASRFVTIPGSQFSWRRPDGRLRTSSCSARRSREADRGQHIFEHAREGTLLLAQPRPASSTISGSPFDTFFKGSEL